MVEQIAPNKATSAVTCPKTLILVVMKSLKIKSTELLLDEES